MQSSRHIYDLSLSGGSHRCHILPVHSETLPLNTAIHRLTPCLCPDSHMCIWLITPLSDAYLTLYRPQDCTHSLYMSDIAPACFQRELRPDPISRSDSRSSVHLSRASSVQYPQTAGKSLAPLFPEVKRPWSSFNFHCLRQGSWPGSYWRTHQQLSLNRVWEPHGRCSRTLDRFQDAIHTRHNLGWHALIVKRSSFEVTDNAPYDMIY